MVSPASSLSSKASVSVPFAVVSTRFGEGSCDRKPYLSGGLTRRPDRVLDVALLSGASVLPLLEDAIVNAVLGPGLSLPAALASD